MSKRLVFASGVEEKACTFCDEVKPFSEFAKRSDSKHGYTSNCKECRNKLSREGPLHSKEEREEIKTLNLAQAVKDGGQICTLCDTFKLFDDFRTDKRRPLGYASWCKKCCYENNKQYKKPYDNRADLEEKYHITSEMYDRKLEEQGGVCALCFNPPKSNIRLHVDHDHSCCPGKKSCGKCVRSLLCFPCNGRLFVLESDSEYAKRLRDYAGVEVIKNEY